MIYRFGPFELDEDASALLRQGEPVALPSRLVDVLLHLLRHRDRVVSHGEILETVWGARSTTRSVVPWSISRLRKVFAEADVEQSVIGTIPRRGYRFQAPVTAVASPDREAASVPRPLAGTAAPASSRRDDTFVGREDALRELASALGATHGGSGALLLLVGEPGVGRTRCAHEFTRRARNEASIWATACGRTPGTAPLSPWIDLLRCCTLEQPRDPALQARAEALSSELRDQSRPGANDAPTTQLLLLFEKICSFIADAARSRTRVLLIDDVDRADTGSLHLLELLTSRVLTCRVMILATLEDLPDAASEPEDAKLLALRSRARLVPLLPWSRAETERVVAGAVAADQVARMTQAVWRRARGNPLLTHELLLHHRLHGEASELRGIDLLDLPSSLMRLTRHRLQTLPPESAAALGAASVQGARFNLTLLHRITGESIPRLFELLDRAHFAGLIQRTDRISEYRFRHEVVHGMVYADLPGDRRALLHLRTGEILRDCEAEDVTPGLLAWHFYCAAPIGGAAEAVRHATRAADDARNLRAYTDEVRFREWALEAHALTESPSPVERCELLISLAIARTDTGEPDVARRHLTRAIEIAESARLADALARAAFILRSSMLLDDHPDPIALRALERAHDTLPEDAHGLRSRVASYLASIPPYSQHPDERWRLLDEAWDLARRQDAPMPLFDALRARCAALMEPARLEELLDLSGEIEALAERAGSARMLHESQQYRYAALVQLGRPVNFAALREKRGRLGRKAALREINWLYRSLAVRHVYYWGLLQNAMDGYRDIRSTSGGVRSWISDAHYGTGMSLIHLELDTSREFWSEFQSVTRGLVRSSRTLSIVAARLRLASGRVDEVRDELPRIHRTQLDREVTTSGDLGVLCQLGLVTVALHDLERCSTLYERLLPYAHLIAVDDFWFSHGSVAHFLGVLAGATGQPEVGRRHLEYALERNLKLGYRVQASWTKYRLARILQASQSSPAEREQASAMLREARDEARRQRLRALLREIDVDLPLHASA